MVEYLFLALAAVGGYVIAWPAAIFWITRAAARGWCAERAELMVVLVEQDKTLRQQRAFIDQIVAALPQESVSS